LGIGYRSQTSAGIDTIPSIHDKSSNTTTGGCVGVGVALGALLNAEIKSGDVIEIYREGSFYNIPPYRVAGALTPTPPPQVQTPIPVSDPAQVPTPPYFVQTAVPVPAPTPQPIDQPKTPPTPPDNDLPVCIGDYMQQKSRQFMQECVGGDF
jgi:hypothetical protein